MPAHVAGVDLDVRLERADSNGTFWHGYVRGAWLVTECVNRPKGRLQRNEYLHESAAVSKGLLEKSVRKKTHPGYSGGAYMIVKTVT